MKCEFCDRNFEKGPYFRVLRGKKHTFCSESCFNLYHYKVPKFDLEKMYTETTYKVPAELFDEVLREATK